MKLCATCLDNAYRQARMVRLFTDAEITTPAFIVDFRAFTSSLGIGPERWPDYDDELAQARARHAKHRAMQTLMGGGDPFMAGLDVMHHRREAEHRTKQQRLLRTPDEVMHTPKDKQIIFLDDLPRPLYADRKAYFDQAFMAGRYHPNPYHPPLDRVRVRTRWGHAWRSVTREGVPHSYRNYPQYQDGTWSRIEA